MWSPGVTLPRLPTLVLLDQATARPSQTGDAQQRGTRRNFEHGLFKAITRRAVRKKGQR